MSFLIKLWNSSARNWKCCWRGNESNVTWHWTSSTLILITWTQFQHKLIFAWYGDETQVSQQFTGRISLIDNHASLGKASINLTSVRESDNGWWVVSEILKTLTFLKKIFINQVWMPNVLSKSIASDKNKRFLVSSLCRRRNFVENSSN